MLFRLQVFLIAFISLFLLLPSFLPAQNSDSSDWQSVDFRYAPANWQTSICLPDDWQKTLVNRDGALLYDFKGSFDGFKTKICMDYEEGASWQRQELIAPRIPIVLTYKMGNGVVIEENTFAVSPSEGQTVPAIRRDILLARLKNPSQEDRVLTPKLIAQSDLPVTFTVSGSLQIGNRIEVRSSLPCVKTATFEKRSEAYFESITIPAGEERILAIHVTCAAESISEGDDRFNAEDLRGQALSYWETLSLPYGRMQVPDEKIQALLDSSIRNIYQAREIKNGLPAFQVGPTVYRGLWVVDGSFILEAVSYLNRVEEARSGIHYLLRFQQENGSFMLIDGHWKETGIVLWAVTRHARLTHDPQWLNEIWPRVERGVDFIRHMRRQASADPQTPNAGLIPDGFSDGGLADRLPEYTNVYWTLAGMQAAVKAAEWIGKEEQAQEWQKEYDDFYAIFHRAVERDAKCDQQGRKYLPIRMKDPNNVLPQKAQWAFLHAVFPGQVFDLQDELVQGNLALLESVEEEGLVVDTGWLEKGVWNYFASFYAHAWLWIGEGNKAADILYAFANHASPLLVWREEQNLVNDKPKFVGDMPHNWASAEFIRLVRHLLVLERGQELHLLEGMPAAWMYPNAVTCLENVLTDFGPITLEVRVNSEGHQAHVKVDPLERNAPDRIVLHLPNRNGLRETMTLPGTLPVDQVIDIR